MYATTFVSSFLSVFCKIDKISETLSLSVI